MIGILSLVQLAAGVAIVHGPCPYYMPEQHFSCYYPSENQIYLLAEDQRDPENHTLLHEFGHADDFTRLTRADRIRFRVAMGYKRTRGWWNEKYSFSDDRADSPSPGEAYAENYMGCALGERWRIRRFCRLLPPSSYALWRRAAL